MSIVESTTGERLRSLARRRFIGTGAAAMVASFLTGRAIAAPTQDDARPPQPMPASGAWAARGRSDPATLLDQFAVSQVIGRERLARETRDYDMEAACFHPDAYVDVSWFSGTGADFVEVGRKAAARGRAATSIVATYFDALSPPVVWIKPDRAIADGSCAVHAFSTLDGIDVHVTAYTRLLWRAQRLRGAWLISGLRGIYIRDTLEPVDPAAKLAMDPQKLARFRSSYRYLSYLSAAGGGPVRDDRAGSDRPDLVAALRAAEWAWLDGRS